MTVEQILLLFFGLPLAILGVGLRRSVGAGPFLFLLVGGALAAAYAVGLDAVLDQARAGLTAPAAVPRGLIRGFGPMAWAAALLGALGAALLRHRGAGSES